VSDIRCKSVAKVPFDIVGVEAAPIRRVYLSDIRIGKAGGENVLEHTEDILFDQVMIGGKPFDENKE
jgi:hypothetical protein